MSELLESFFSDLLHTDAPSVVEWLQENVELPPRFSPNEPGQFSTLSRPYMREPLECFHPQSGVTDLNLCWGSQAVKTATLVLGTAYRLKFVPLPVLWVMPTEALGRSFSGTRFQPLIHDNPCFADIMPENPDDFNLLEMHFLRQTVNIVGSNSPANLASRPVGIVIQDEVCKFARASAEESSAMKLADQRTKTFARALRAKASTPTTAEHEFWLDFLAGDQRYFFVPCPHCSGKLRFEHQEQSLQWDPSAKKDGRWNLSRVRETAHYVCPHCKGKITDQHKPTMLLGGEWIPQNLAADSGRRSYHLSSFYSPDVTFGTMAVKFLESENLFGLQDYYNGWLALPWQQQVANVKEEAVMACRGSYHIGEISIPPEELAYVAITADPGQKETHWMTTAFSVTGECRIIDCGTVLAIEDMLPLADRIEYLCGAEKISPTIGVIDSGDFTERVYDFCSSSDGLFVPSKGSPAMFARSVWAQNDIKSHEDLQLYTYVDYMMKRHLYIEKILLRMPPLLHLPANSPPALLHGLSGQQLLEKNTPTGKAKYWKIIPWDHWGDCLKLAYLSWWVLRENYLPDPEDPAPTAQK